MSGASCGANKPRGTSLWKSHGSKVWKLSRGRGRTMEEEQLSVPESSVVCVKKVESSPLQRRQTEHREETQGEEPRFRSEAENSGLSLKHKSAAETSDGDASGAEEKKKQCSFCQKVFNNNGRLRVHMRSHTVEKPFSCSFCGKSFDQKSVLKIHQRIHTGERPYSCPVCGKGFAQTAHLKSHMKTHREENEEEVLFPRIVQVRGNVQDLTETAQMKEESEEQSVKREEEQPPGSSVVCQRSTRQEPRPSLFVKNYSTINGV